MADYRKTREGTVQHFNSGSVVQEGYTVVARQPRGAAPGNIVSMDRAEEFERTGRRIEEIYDNAPMSARRARLMRATRDVSDDEPYLDYEG